MSDCLSGCTSLGQHMSHCDDEACRGCMPRTTEIGNLCGRCWSNLQRDVRTAPSIVDWIREHVAPSSQWGERVNSKEIDAPAPLGINAVDDADELHAMLASWALLVLEEHPSGLHLRVTNVRKTLPTVREVTQPAYKAWCDLCGVIQQSDSFTVLQTALQTHATHADVQVRQNQRRWSEVQELRPRDVGVLPDSDATVSICKFLATHLEWCAGQDWVDEMVREVGSQVRTLLARYPDAERSRHLDNARCPACERTSMVYTPPTWLGADILVQCDHNACGCIVPEDHWGLFMAMVAEDRKRELEAS